MSIRIQRIINVVVILLSWITIPFMGWRNIKRFFPASIFMVLLTCIDSYFGKQRRWWQFYNKPQSFFRDEFPYGAGPFFASSMWILKISYGNFKKFLSLNAVMALIFAFPIAWLSKKLKLFKLVRLNNFQFFLFYFYKIFLMYGLQFYFENRRRNH